MFQRVLVSAFLASVVGLGCGGEAPQAGEGTEAPVSQDTAALVETCETRQTRYCSPIVEPVSCYYSDGTYGECYCPPSPYNKWVCFRDS